MVTFRFLSFRQGLAGVYAIGFLLFAGQGCKREEIQVYRVAKDPSPSVDGMGATTPGPSAAPTTPIPEVKYILPTGWEDRGPAGMRVATFTVQGTTGQAAEISVVPMPGVVGRDLDLVNMWRDNDLGLDTIAEVEMTKLAQPVLVGNEQGKLFEMSNPKPKGESKTTVGVMGAIMQKDDITWFVKMTGEMALVKDQKAAFTNFLQSLKFEPADVSAAPGISSGRFGANSKEAPRSVDTKPAWTPPPDWQEVPGGAMLVAKFAVSGKDGAKADVNIGQAGGGAGANIVRWRNQLALPAVSPEEAEKQGTSLDLPSGKSLLVDLKGTDARTGQPSRILGVISPRGNEMWFYKFMGNPELVQARKEEFLGFVRSVIYPHAP
jgi:hypothetical protein